MVNGLEKLVMWWLTKKHSFLEIKFFKLGHLKNIKNLIILFKKSNLPP